MSLLQAMAAECDHVVELGVRDGSGSTTAFLRGAKKLTSYDINIITTNHLGKLEALARDNAADWSFIMGDSREVTIPICDMLFIDTDHTFDQLSKELELHGDQSRKWIVLHDTWTFPKLGNAITLFLASNRSWFVKEVYLNNNGLTVLERMCNVDMPYLSAS